jgi:hypothetical protein
VNAEWQAIMIPTNCRSEGAPLAAERRISLDFAGRADRDSSGRFFGPLHRRCGVCLCDGGVELVTERPRVAAAGIGLGCDALITRIPGLARTSAEPAPEACAGIPRTGTTPTARREVQQLPQRGADAWQSDASHLASNGHPVRT